MILDVLSCLKAGGIASHYMFALLLIPSYIVNPHDGREHQTIPHDLCPGVTETKIQYHRHWLLRDETRAYVAIGSYCTPIEEESCLISNFPVDVGALALARNILERVLLILLPVVPLLVQVCCGGNGLLIWTARITICIADAVVRE